MSPEFRTYVRSQPEQNMCLGSPFAFGLLLSPPGEGLAPSPSTLWWAPLGEWQLFIFWSNFIFTKVMDLKIQVYQNERTSVSCPPPPPHPAPWHFTLLRIFTSIFLNYMLIILLIDTSLNLLFWLPRICILPFSTFFLFILHASLCCSLLLVCHVLALGMWLWDVIRVQWNICVSSCQSLFITFWWDPYQAHVIIFMQYFSVLSWIE